MFRDLQFSMRRLSRSPGFSATVILLLGLALGANACVFSVIYGLLYKPLPFADAQRLVSLDTRFTSMNLGFNLGLSVPYLDEIARHSQTLANVAAYSNKSVDMREGDSDSPSTLRTVQLQPGLLGLLDVRPVSGRLFNADDALAGAAPSAMISWDLWQNRYAGADDVVKQTLVLDDKPYRIIGVLPREFHFPDINAQVWTPLSFTAANRTADQAGNFSDTYALARLKPGVTAADAGGEMLSIARNTAGLKEILGVTGFQASAQPLRTLWIGSRQPALDLMLLAVALILLVTAANVCNLYIARSLMRRHETALLEALGAGTWRQFRRIAGETSMLSFAGALLGIALLPAGLALLANFDLLPQDTPQHIGIDMATIVFVAALALILTGLMTLAGMLLRRGNVHDALKHGSTRQTSGRSAQRTRKALIVAQIALTAALLFGTGLLLRSVHHLLGENVGFDRDHLLMTAIGLNVDAQADAAERERERAVLRSIVEQARGLPGVVAVGLGNMTPFGENVSVSKFIPPGMVDMAQDEQPTAHNVFVNEDYFRALGLPLIRGRAFNAQDVHSGALLAVVDADFVQRYCAGHDAIGQTFRFGIPGQDKMQEVTIVGVAATVKQRSLDEIAERPTIYLPPRESFDPTMVPSSSMLLLRSQGDPDLLAEPFRQLVREIAPRARLADVGSMRDWIAKTLQDRLRLNTLLELLATMAVILAAVGLYAVLAYAVRIRTQEFGVRMALGADGKRILGQVLGQGLRLIALGLVLGMPLAYTLAKLLGARLYHVDALDPLTLFGVVALLAVVGTVACWWPARSAARVDPINALRAE